MKMSTVVRVLGSVGVTAVAVVSLAGCGSIGTYSHTEKGTPGYAAPPTPAPSSSPVNLHPAPSSDTSASSQTSTDSVASDTATLAPGTSPTSTPAAFVASSLLTDMRQVGTRLNQLTSTGTALPVQVTVRNSVYTEIG